MDRNIRGLERLAVMGDSEAQATLNRMRKRDRLISTRRVCDAIASLLAVRCELLESEEFAMWSETNWNRDTWCECETGCEDCDAECCGRCFAIHCSGCSLIINETEYKRDRFTNEYYFIVCPPWGEWYCESCFWHGMTWHDYSVAHYPALAQ